MYAKAAVMSSQHSADYRPSYKLQQIYKGKLRAHCIISELATLIYW